MQHEEFILIGDKFFLDICFSWFELGNKLSQSRVYYVMRFSEFDHILASHRFVDQVVDPKYMIDQRRLPDAGLGKKKT